MALPLKYNLRNIIVRKGSTLATAFTIGLTVAVFLLVLALARGIDMPHQHKTIHRVDLLVGSFNEIKNCR